ncbi:MAG: alpha-1,4-glucan--maltose-1-phosphate maltosyltransferase [Candidatus Nanopelagicaceae bacterium]|nr:alpha-1,4-glucan--maltose-1-phosphate maltosyltransferase [Candidatus Nanopelagicaceae bacterium]
MIGRIPITDVSPVSVLGREFVPVKAIPDEIITVSATVFREGHDAPGAQVVVLDSSGVEIHRKRMVEIWPGSDRYQAELALRVTGDFSFFIESFDDQYATWHHDSEIKISANIDPELCCEMGALIFEEAINSSPSKLLIDALNALQNKSLAPANRFSIASSGDIRNYFYESPLRRLVTKTDLFPIRVDRERALFGAWYEFFPRSEGATATTSGTFATATRRLNDVVAMGFDVLYLPPIHPIGETFRKGANNSLQPGVNEPGVPWAIGNKDGGHDAINPELGTMKDFESFVSNARAVGLEIAMDFALQVSPDHPWVKAHPEWFNHRPDGTIAYAENPPKKYQDIYPLNFDKDYQGILGEATRIIRFWVSKGVTIFRVDNPHTKPVHFWQELLGIIREQNPEVIFLAEAFTRPPMMHALGKVGFHQSYTYFTWRTSKQELISYGNEVATETCAFFRPNFWVNTPDILPFHLQTGIPAIFALRAVLASTLSPSWGMYAGYELFEHEPLSEGVEEYKDSEKYQIRIRDWKGAEEKGHTLAPFIGTLNQIRKEHRALQRLRNLVFHNTGSDAIIAYSKKEGADLILVVVNLDPINPQETVVHWDMNALGIDSENFTATDLTDRASFEWSRDTYIRLDPTGSRGKVAHIAHVNLG